MSQPLDSFAIADAILEDALDLPPAERAALVARRCAGDAELQALVERLLDGIDELEAPPANARETLVPGGALAGALGADLHRALAETTEAPLAGTRIGRYRLLRELGRGGMAVVYLAERADGEFAQQVAIKLLRHGLDSKDLVARFEQERQILAATHHPGIARLLDGGVTPEGRPYLAMEYVEGLPFDLHADRQRLTVRDRVRLFLQVGRAVEDAHRNLVIHRDIKPSNVLVTAEGHAKLLDFGIAKLFDPHAPSDVTHAEARLLTPAYASPEQVEGAPVTTASDVYQLGMLLYVLLASRLPYRAKTAPPAPASGNGAKGPELARAITDGEPMRLAVAASTGAGMGTGGEGATFDRSERVAEARSTTPARLRRALAGDLETIVAKALRKEPGRRYGSVAQLLDDLERYLDGRPIGARPDSLTYRLGKFAARHRAAVATAAVALLLVAGIAVAYTLRLRQERDRAEHSAAEARQVAEFLRGLFAISAPTRSPGQPVTARQLLDQGAARIDRELKTQPALAADMMTLMGQVYGELALYGEARPLLERAVALRRSLPGPERRALATSLEALARVRAESGSLQEGRKLYREAVALRETDLARTRLETGETETADPELGRALDGMGRVLALQGKYALAAHLHQRAAVLLETALGPRSPDLGKVLHNLGYALRRSNQHKEAKPVLERALAILNAHYGTGHPLPAETRDELGVVLWGMFDLEGATVQLRLAVPALVRAYGLNHPKVALALLHLGSVRGENGDLAGAIPLIERALRIREETLGPRHPDVANALIALGRMKWLSGELDPALLDFEAARSILEESVGPEHPDLSIVFDCTAGVLERLGRLDEARASYGRAIAVREQALGATSLSLYMPLYSLASLERKMQDFTGAERSYRRLIELGQAYPSTRHMTAMPQINLARCLTAQRRYAEAEPLLLPFAGPKAEPPVRREAADALATLYAAWGKPAPSTQYRQLWKSLPESNVLHR